MIALAHVGAAVTQGSDTMSEADIAAKSVHPPSRLRAFLAEHVASDGLTAPRPAGPPDLRDLRASPADLRLALEGDDDKPGWLSPDTNGLNLAGAQLVNARLEGADLSYANLGSVRAAGSLGRSARFDGAILENADFAEADLSGASFTKVAAGEVSFAKAMLEDAKFAGAVMRFARFSGASLDGADFEGADLWGADFGQADADESVFRGARLDEADLSDVNLTGADFSGASMKRAKLAESRLKGANLTDVKLDGADLSGADLSDATLARLNLLTCKLEGVRLSGAWLNNTRLRVDQLGGAIGEELTGDYEAAAAGYQILERNFLSIGSKDEASWAYKRGRRMGRYLAGSRALETVRAGDTRAFLGWAYAWAADRFVEWLCDYGESLSRIIRAFVILIFVFAALYGLAAGLIAENGAATRNPLDLLSYSTLNMLTSNPPDLGLKVTGRFTNILVGIQGAVGIIMMGLFGFVLGNRLRR